MAAAAAAKRDSRGPLHVVVFPWLAFGHTNPFLELSEQLAKRGHLVTFLSAPRNIARLRPIPPALCPRIRLLPLPLPRVDGLPDGAESTADVPPEKVELLKLALDGLAPHFAAFLAEACASSNTGSVEEEEEWGEGKARRPDWIVVDFAHHWLPPIAAAHGVPCALFHTAAAAFLAFLGPRELNAAHPRSAAEDFTAPPPWIPSSPSPIAYRRHEAEWIAAQACRPNASGVSDLDRFWTTSERCALLVCRSCREVDGTLCALASDLYGKPVLPCGLLAPYDAAAGARAGEESLAAAADLLRWLDAQPEESVLYVALGSEAPLEPAHARALALGLELAGVRFLWALRPPPPPSGSGEQPAPPPPLPDGFERRVAGRGLVRVGWVPQVRVLAHAAVGAFLTHAGWGSLVEGLLLGRPAVMLPLFADQGLAARLMAARRVGLEVPRGDGGGLAGEDVARAVRRVMVEEEGEELARNARELQELLWDRPRQERYMDELVEHLLQRPED